jgi:hypothetical protein
VTKLDEVQRLIAGYQVRYGGAHGSTSATIDLDGHGATGAHGPDDGHGHGPDDDHGHGPN